MSPTDRRPKLGQHFLADPRYRRRIAEAISVGADDLVIEIGPGWGAMTGLLAERARHVVAVEIDRALAEQLKSRMEGDPRIEVLQGDILSTDLEAICRRYSAEQCYVLLERVDRALVATPDAAPDPARSVRALA